MLFAAVDYLRYRRRAGRYSLDRMEREFGLRVCRPENFPNLDSTPPLSMLFSHGYPSIVSWLVMYFTDSPISHVAMFGRNGQIQEATKDAGVIQDHASSYFDGKSCMVVCELSRDQLETMSVWQTRGTARIAAIVMNLTQKTERKSTDEILELMERQLGKPYGTRKAVTLALIILCGPRPFRWCLFFDCAILACVVQATVIVAGFQSFWPMYVLAALLVHIILFITFEVPKPTPDDLWRQCQLAKEVGTKSAADLEKVLAERIKEQERSWIRRRIDRSRF